MHIRLRAEGGKMGACKIEDLRVGKGCMQD